MIRRARKDDSNALLRLCAEHADYEKLPFQIAEQIMHWQSIIFSDSPKIYAWVVEIDGELSGYMTATIDYATWTGKPFIYMDCLFLQEPLRGQGIGHLLIKTLQLFAQENRCNEIQWHTPPHNDIGISFYRKIKVTERPKVRFFLDSKELK